MPPAKPPWNDSGIANRAPAAISASEGDDEQRRDAPEDEGDDVENVARGGSRARVEGNGATQPSSPSPPRKHRG
jgi:hypothetical protein